MTDRDLHSGMSRGPVQLQQHRHTSSAHPCTRKANVYLRQRCSHALANKLQNMARNDVVHTSLDHRTPQPQPRPVPDTPPQTYIHTNQHTLLVPTITTPPTCLPQWISSRTSYTSVASPSRSPIRWRKLARDTVVRNDAIRNTHFGANPRYAFPVCFIRYVFKEWKRLSYDEGLTARRPSPQYRL